MTLKNPNYYFIYYQMYKHKYKEHYESKLKREKEICWEKETNYYYNTYKKLMLKKAHSSEINSG